MLLWIRAIEVICHSVSKSIPSYSRFLRDWETAEQLGLENVKVSANAKFQDGALSLESFLC